MRAFVMTFDDIRRAEYLQILHAHKKGNPLRGFGAW
jgi:hypothetical protein